MREKRSVTPVGANVDKRNKAIIFPINPLLHPTSQATSYIIISRSLMNPVYIIKDLEINILIACKIGLSSLARSDKSKLSVYLVLHRSTQDEKLVNKAFDDIVKGKVLEIFTAKLVISACLYINETQLKSLRKKSISYMTKETPRGQAKEPARRQVTRNI